MSWRIVALGQGVTDRGKLRAIVAKMAADGYAVLEEEFVLGGSATAAPPLGSDGTIVAALNVGNGFRAVFRPANRESSPASFARQPASRLRARGIGLTMEGMQR